MPKFVSFVFKVLIGTILIVIFTTFITCAADLLITIRRVQDIAQVVQIDIADNNCLQNSVYENYKARVDDALERSSMQGVRFMNWGTHDGDAVGQMVAGTDQTDDSIELYVPEAIGGSGRGNDYIQTDSAQLGVAAESRDATRPDDGSFLVANYGDILTFRTNLRAMFAFMYWDSTGTETVGGKDRNISNWLDSPWYVVSTPITIEYNIPALTYLK